MDRAHPGEVTGAPAHGFRPRQGQQGLFQETGQDGSRLFSLLFNHGEIEVTFVQRADLGLADIAQAVALHEPGQGLFR